MRRQGWKFASFAGAPILVSPSFLILALLVAILNLPQAAERGAYGTAAWALPIGTVVILFLSVLVHELAHAVVGFAAGRRPTEIVLNVWGGHTQFGYSTPSAGRSALIAVVGPLANLVLAALAFAALRMTTGELSVTRDLIFSAFFYNVILGIFNLVPGHPLDGGAVLESVVWGITGKRATGTLVAGWLGRIFAVALVGYAVLRAVTGSGSTTTLLWTALIATTLWTAASQAISQAGLRQRAEDLDLGAFVRSAIAIDAQAPASEVFRVITSQGDVTPQYVVTTSGGQPVGLVTPADVFSLSSTHPSTPIGAIATPQHAEDTLPVGARGEAVLARLMNLHGNDLVVTDDARVVGVVPIAALMPVLFPS